MMDERAQLILALADELVRQRIAAGRDVEEVANAAGIDAGRLSSAEAAEVALEPAELTRLAEVYGVDVSALFGGRTTPLSYLFGV